ncbi:hypothetical protein F9C07_2277651 [Aspergillus flavus]|uniref:Uncharacterized protein n=1 Tax=Aspergillus flavus (strain ATCC 200026 / FGSC A1120 / IAM 13836 / NRRL 3357 / JCM 12722 / SRRC 167) TaxID=332952 RepID=A0A7U2MEP1_ASPFN|nr:hypothetical protein F9C07_2277651 [Aspergillus flavus]
MRSMAGAHRTGASNPEWLLEHTKNGIWESVDVAFTTSRSGGVEANGCVGTNSIAAWQ